MKDTMTVDEAAQRLQLSRGATYDAVRRGEIPAIRLGRRWLIPLARFEREVLGLSGGLA